MDTKEVQRGKRRGWIKNAAIIFLAIMLLLTFFSNTIMNRSLPEVAAKTVTSGTISAKIRGTGTVAANSAYEVKVKENRVIKTVAVRKGDTVEVGDVLFILEEGESTGLQELRDQLVSRRATLRAQLTSARSVNADVTGFFVNYSDGYESIYTPDLAGKLTVPALRELKAAPAAPVDDAIGKLVEGYTWYFCCEADKRLADSLTAGKTYTLHFSYAPEQDVLAVLESIVVSGEDGYVLTFSSTRVTDELLLLRSHTASIVRTKHEGLRVRNEARRVIDGQVGVFVRSGLTMEFRPIEVVYADEMYSIVKWESGKSGVLKLYDEVVVTGKDLYDGKIIS